MTKPAVVNASPLIYLARANPGSRAIIDDLQGRRCAEASGISLRGTLGLVLLAKRTGHIDKARPILDQLRSAGMYLSSTVANAALSLVGE